MCAPAIASPTRKLHAATTRYIASLVPSDGVWLQDPQAYHTTVFHASTHQHPVPAATAEVDAEAGAALRALRPLCPVFAVLDRVVATPGGAVLACWQVVPGSTEPRHVREALRAALAKAPAQQARTKRGRVGGYCKSYDMGNRVGQEASPCIYFVKNNQLPLQTVSNLDILHTTLARLVTVPGPEASLAGAERLAAAAAAMTRELCGLETRFDRLWCANHWV